MHWQEVTSFTLVWIKIYYLDIKVPGGKVTSFTLVWIKIELVLLCHSGADVTSFTLVWIKIVPGLYLKKGCVSRASRSCGLKCNARHAHHSRLGHELHARVD